MRLPADSFKLIQLMAQVQTDASHTANASIRSRKIPPNPRFPTLAQAGADEGRLESEPLKTVCQRSAVHCESTVYP